MKKKLIYEQIQPATLGMSQKGQDSLIDFTFNTMVGTTNKYYIEFGAMDGYQLCNTYYFREHQGWKGLLLEGNHQNFNFTENFDINLHIRRLSKNTICDTFKEFNVPNEPDFLCIDIDGMDYWMVDSILKGCYRPRVIMIECNVRFEPNESCVIKYDENWDWDGADWYGASPYAFKKLFNSYDYVPVWIHIDDMIVIRRDVLEENGYSEPEWSYVYPKSNVALYDGHRLSNGKFVSELNTDKWQKI
jgi:hypothetical protein